MGAPVDSCTAPLPLEPWLLAPWLREPLDPPDEEEPPEPELAWRVSLPKKAHHTLSTLSGSFWYFSYISSTSHSLAPNPDMELSSVDSGTASFASSKCALCGYG